MSASLRSRLILSYLAVVLIGMGVVAPLVWLGVEHLYINTVSASLLAQAQVVAAALESQPVRPDSPGVYSQSSNLSPGIHTRVIDAQGGVVIDFNAPANPSPSSSHSPSSLNLPPLVQNAASQVSTQELLARPEIIEALQGRPATAQRRVYAGNEGLVLYAAAPVHSAPGGQVAQIVYLATPLPDTRLSALPLSLRWQIGGILLGALLISTAAGVLIARRIARPLTALADAADQLADRAQADRLSAIGKRPEDSTSSHAPEKSGILELDILGQSFNRMTAALRQSDQAKTAFVSDVSHELRTPLTVIKGAIETLQDGAVDDPLARETFFTSMNKETERLIRLVNDLLVLTRADAGALNLRLEPLNLVGLVQERCDYFTYQTKEKQVQFIVNRPANPQDPEEWSVMADPDRICQVIDNLLDNALRYAPSGSQISISLLREGREIGCQVKDEGPGIPAQHLPFIFERFYRADPARERESGRKGGSGLGLAIARSLVQAHRGRIEAASVEGQGAAFTFWLPGQF